MSVLPFPQPDKLKADIAAILDLVAELEYWRSQVAEVLELDKAWVDDAAFREATLALLRMARP